MNLRPASWFAFSSLAMWATACGGQEFVFGDQDAGVGSSVGGSSNTTGGAGITGVAGSSQTAASGAGGNVGTSGSNGTGGGGTSGSNTGGASGAGGGPDGGMAGQAGGGQGGGTGRVDAGNEAGGVCPTAQPSSGSDCNPEGLSCRYGACCPAVATCSSGRWQVAIPPCLPPMCPSQAPANGSSCECFAGLNCHYDTCSQTQLESDATCVSNAWTVQTYGCENACGVEDCAGGQICLVRKWNPALRCQSLPAATAGLQLRNLALPRQQLLGHVGSAHLPMSGTEVRRSRAPEKRMKRPCVR